MPVIMPIFVFNTWLLKRVLDVRSTTVKWECRQFQGLFVDDLTGICRNNIDAEEDY